MKLSDYINSIKNKRIAVIGIGISNTPLLGLLLSGGCRVTACDRSERAQLGALADQLEEKGATLRLGPDYLKGLDADIIFRTPGMRPDLPELQAAIDKGAVLTSEMEVFFDVCPCRMIAVTGSEGKTTTATIITRLLEAGGYTVSLGGNIGTPLLSRADDMKPEDLVVLELSSFQLMTMKKSPSIAAVTNMTPNHLNVHHGMEEYIDAKRNILRWQGVSDTVVLNYDNKITRGFADIAKGEIRFFSHMERVDNGVYLENGTIFDAVGGKPQPVMAASEIFLGGIHNADNFMTAFAVTHGLVSHETMRRVAMEFHGVAHRCEYVRTLHGVKYYNDSIATSYTPTIAGLRAFGQKVIMLAGGMDKGVPYDELGPVIVDHVKTLVLTGLTAGPIRQSVLKAPNYAGSPEIIEKEDFKEAVLAASAAASEGDIVFFSPASTSFDRFKNFEERGNTFKEIINELA
jgi:UDP-N-acetylmuramoylalanine--D-glutamate ligase